MYNLHICVKGDAMKKYLIALDLDGTLLNGFYDYDQETFLYLKKLIKMGNLVMIATGRPFRSSYFIYKELGLDTPIINYNGARISNPLDKNFKETDIRIERDDLLNIISHIKDNLINVFCEIHDNIYVYNLNDDIAPFLHLDGGNLFVGDLSDILPDNPNGALLFINEEYVPRFFSYIENEYQGKLLTRYYHMSNYHIVEIYNPIVDKNKGFLEAINYYQIDPNNTIAIGDGHNDIGMIKTANYGIAMKNSHPDLLKVAKIITDDANNQGVLKALKQIFEK